MVIKLRFFNSSSIVNQQTKKENTSVSFFLPNNHRVQNVKYEMTVYIYLRKVIMNKLQLFHPADREDSER